MSQHASIFRASFFTGGAQVVTSLASLARVKFIALVLGVAGVGTNGLLFQASGLVQSALGFGIGSSGIRAIAGASALGDSRMLSKTVRSLRTWVWLTGLLCLGVCTLFSHHLSILTFGNEDHAIDFTVLGFAALFQQISAGQAALLRGLRKIKELAKMNILAAIGSLLFTAPCIWFLGSHGIAISFLASACVTLLCSWWFARQIYIEPVGLTMVDIWVEGRELLNAGLAFVGTALAGGLASYLGALIVRQSLGLEGNGYYQAGMGVTVVLVGFVLAAMGQDYYPKLVALMRNGEKVGKHIQDQVDMALLMSVPLLTLVSSLAPWILHLAYSEKFVSASGVVTWLAVGSLSRIVSWPLGYALLAEGKNAVILSFEIFIAFASVAFAYLGVKVGGLEGAAIAFAILELLHWLTLIAITSSRFKFSMPAWLYGHIFAGFLTIMAGRWIGPVAGIPLSLLSALVCLKIVISRLGPAHRLVKMVARLPLLGRLCNSSP